MSVSKIKNMVIAALVLLNAFFLIIIALDRTDDAQRERQALGDACAVLAHAGIALDPGDVEHAPSLNAMNTTRDLTAQRTVAEAVLGEVTEFEQGGGGIVYQYDNEKTGSAVFKSGGEFTININADVYTSSDDITGITRGLLRGMGIEYDELEVMGDDTEQAVTAFGTYRGTRIFNCAVSFRFSGGSLYSVSGKLVSGITEAEDAAALSQPATALLMFLSSVKKSEIFCERIDRVQAGYYARDATAFLGGSLTPVWLIETGSGRYIVDTVTSEILQMPD